MMKKTLPAIFHDAVGKESRRYSIAAPWHQKPYWYATDGTIIVRWRGPKSAAPQNKGHHPDGSALPWDDVYETMAIDLPLNVETESCKACDGIGLTTCPQCNSEITCASCHGEDWADVPIAVAERSKKTFFKTLFIRRSYIQLLRKYSAIVYLNKANPTSHPARFVVDDVEGLIAPANAPANR